MVLACVQGLAKDFHINVSCSLREAEEQDRSFGDRRLILTLPLKAKHPSGKVSSTH